MKHKLKTFLTILVTVFLIISCFIFYQNKMEDSYLYGYNDAVIDKGDATAFYLLNNYTFKCYDSVPILAGTWYDWTNRHISDADKICCFLAPNEDYMNHCYDFQFKEDSRSD